MNGCTHVTACLRRLALEFSSRYPHGGSQVSVTVAAEDPMLSSARMDAAHKQTYTQAEHHTHKIKRLTKHLFAALYMYLVLCKALHID